MITFNNFTKKTNFEWVLDRDFRDGMIVPVKVFGSETILKNALNDKAMEQAVNSASLPGLMGQFCVMPDIHQGYGFPIGGVAASDFETGVISPGGIGYDINCGVRLLSSTIPVETAMPFLEDLAQLLFQNCPKGMGKQGVIEVSMNDFQKIAQEGSKWALRNGYAIKSDIDLTEDQGSLPGADLSAVSLRAVERGKGQVGSLGSGNHFIEVDAVEEIYNQEAAAVLGLSKNTLAVQIHSGSRGFGHQICSDYVREFQQVIQKYRIQIPDRELVCAPVQSKEGQRYLAAMRCAANFAYCNRQLLSFVVRDAFEMVFSREFRAPDLTLVYDLAHNIGKIETHIINGVEVKVVVHRKGATRAFGPGRMEIPEKYRKIGQPVLIPGSMGTSSWVTVGTESAMEKSFGSCCHGAGRVLSRTQVKKNINGRELSQQLRANGILTYAGSMSGLSEEAPAAYKDINSVVESAVGAGLVESIARLRPLVVIKG